ncbi:LysE family translocator [Reinekea blandensis]|uniref:Putative threonine efflux protein n=1 Tax=Reinekea blandensis MED297 TaxID=314283 RepID=A4BDE5_9GAMM|nr:LysE family translocator [Reinekea blandensis]EAR09889.1 Putative threonine efflux protein [Reinekea sp. MED297] [Reinekea blandensis MED297]
MTLTAWLTIVGICALGAMSPGPSLAVVLKHTLAGGRRQGMTAAITHGLGVGLYAFVCVSGLAVVILTSETLFTILQWGGAGYLLWMGIKGLLSRSNPNQQLPDVEAKEAARDGFMIVFLNPKIAVFFIALFSQVVGTDTTLVGKFAYASTAMIIDGLWYVVVAWLFSNPRWLAVLQQQAVWLDRIFGVVLMGLAGKLAVELV